MSQKPYLYALVHIRKSGSQSLVEMVRGALTTSKIYSVPPPADQGVGLLEDFRRIRRTKKRHRKLFHSISFPQARNILNGSAREGDVVSGHRPAWQRRHLVGRLEAAGKGRFGDYIGYLYARVERLTKPRVGYINGGVVVEKPDEFPKANYFHYGTMERMDLFAEGLSKKLGSAVTTTGKNRTDKVHATDSAHYDRSQLESFMAKDLALFQAVAAKHES